MGNKLKQNERKFENKASQKYASREIININSEKEKYLQFNNDTLFIKDIKNQKNNIIKEQNINLGILETYLSNYKTKRKNIRSQNLLVLEIIKYFIISILFCRFCIINSFHSFEKDKIYKIIKYYSHEITLKVKGKGKKNILSGSSPYIYPCPSNIYINKKLSQAITDCHYLDITESESEIKLIWNNNNIKSTKGMFHNCKDIIEIDMTKFDTSLVTDMSYMFALCESLKSLNVDNLNTAKVVTFENMFYNCKSLTSLNLERFTNPSATSLYRMFYGCENLEYINIKNFDEKDNMNIDEMFDSIPQNAVICYLLCPAPSNFTITSMNEANTIISWEGNEWNKYVISYGLQSLVNPEDGNKIYVNDKTNYIFTNLNHNLRYDIYLKTNCGSKCSKWIPTENYYMAHNGTYSLTTCSKVIYDSGGPNGNYKDFADSTLTIYPDESGKLISIKGTIDIEMSNYDHLYIYDGVGINGILLASYHSGSSNIPLIMSSTGPLTIKFKTDSSVVRSGFELFVSCNINSHSQKKTIYNLINDNNCQLISCDNNWLIKQNLIILDPVSSFINDGCSIPPNKYYTCPSQTDNYYYNVDKKYICLYGKECPNNYKYIIEEKKQCVNDCKNYPDFSFGFQKKCYNACPPNISKISDKKENYCEIICPKELPFELIETQKCVNNCALKQIISNLCVINFKNDNKNEENEAQENKVENVRKEITNGFDTSDIDAGKDIVIQEKDITITISRNDNQKNQINSKTNYTSIDLGECETKLKEEYNISQTESLYILKMDVKQEGYKIPKIEYEVYYPLNGDSKLCLLNLSICDNTDINVYLPLELDGNLNQYDPNSDFYNDICNTFTSENGTDLTLSERKHNYINNNLTICEEDCNLEQYNETIRKAKCSCKVKAEFVNKISENVLSKENLLKNFVDFNNIFNIKILKCLYLILTIKVFKDNYANDILSAIVALYFIILIIFICKGYKDEIKFYIDIIVYFTLFPNKILSILSKREKKEKKQIPLRLNKYHKFNIYKIINVQNSQGILLNSKNKFIKKGVISNPIKKNINLNFTKRKSVNIKKSNKIILNDKAPKRFNKFETLKEVELYKLYKKVYTKTDNELNDLSYKDALKYDKRTYFTFYCSLVKSNHLLFFSFFSKFDFNSRIIKIYLFFFNFATFFFVNALFFTDETMGKINIDGGSFNFLYNLPQILYSSIISSIINTLIRMFALTENSFIEYRNTIKKVNTLKID